MFKIKQKSCYIKFLILLLFFQFNSIDSNEKEGIPIDVIQVLDVCLEIPQLGVIRSLNVHVSAAIGVWEYTKQQLAYKKQ